MDWPWMRQEMLTFRPSHQQIEPSFETMAPAEHAISQNLSFVQHCAVRFDPSSTVNDRVHVTESQKEKKRAKAGIMVSA
jgi:hypothetical protein